MTELAQTKTTALVREKHRGHFDTQDIYPILDATPLCHIGYVSEGRQIVTPTIHWRQEDYVYWHGSRAARSLQTNATSEVCLTVTLMDGLVLARSAFSHSMNFRSVMIFGQAKIIDDVEEKTQSLKHLVDHLYPERWDTLRNMTRKELNATTVLALPITEASAKVRTGGPGDGEDDSNLPIWAGVVPITTTMGEPIPCTRMPDGVAEPEHVTHYTVK